MLTLQQKFDKAEASLKLLDTFLSDHQKKLKDAQKALNEAKNDAQINIKTKAVESLNHVISQYTVAREQVLAIKVEAQAELAENAPTIEVSGSPSNSPKKPGFLTTVSEISTKLSWNKTKSSSSNDVISETSKLIDRDEAQRLKDRNSVPHGKAIKY